MPHLISSLRQANGDVAWLSTEGKPWHGLGTPMPPEASLDEWLVKAGMDYEVREAEVKFLDGELLYGVPERKVLFRSDNRLPLSIVSDRYQVVQPREIIEFYRELTEFMGFRMETAGVLKKGAMYWALARVGEDYKIGGEDKVLPYLLLATSCDGTMSTVVHLTAIRVVCWNTLALSVGVKGERATLRVPHVSKFDPEAVKQYLGLIPSWWTEFQGVTERLVNRKVTRQEAVAYFIDVLQPEGDISIAETRPLITSLMEVYENGVGQSLPTAQNTAWGLVCAVTRYVDHERGRDADTRLRKAWFGKGADLKNTALTKALELV